MIKKKITFYHDLNVARKKSKTLDFYHFVNDLPETIKCDEKNCIFLHFIIPLREVFLSDGDKSYEEQREFFVKQCLKYPEVFHSMFLRRKKGAEEDSVIFWPSTVELFVEDFKLKRNQMAQVIESLDDIVDFAKMNDQEKKEFWENILKRHINLANSNVMNHWLAM